MKGELLHINHRKEIGQEARYSQELTDFIGIEMEQVEEYLKRTISDAPVSLKHNLYSLSYLYQGRICSTLFLICVKMYQYKKRNLQTARFAASMEVLNMALTAHQFAQKDNNYKSYYQVSDLLGGDYLFSVALFLACDVPQAVKGMTEVINKYVEAEFMPSLGEVDLSRYKRSYLQRLSYQKASILPLSCTLGCWFGGMTSLKKEIAYFAHSLGMIRQVSKELTEFEANYTTWLKNTPRKIIISLPVIYIIEVSPHREALLKTLERSFFHKNERELWEKEIKNSNYRDYIINLLNQNYNRAYLAIDKASSHEGKHYFLEILEKEIKKALFRPV